jgi:hypothetical protein
MRLFLNGAVFSTFILAALPSQLGAQPVIVNDNVNFTFGGRSFGFWVSKVADDDGESGTFAGFTDFPTLQSIAGAESSADEGSDWYLVQPGELFSRATIADGEFPLVLSLRYGAFETVAVGPGDFF